MKKNKKLIIMPRDIQVGDILKIGGLSIEVYEIYESSPYKLSVRGFFALGGFTNEASVVVLEIPLWFIVKVKR